MDLGKLNNELERVIVNFTDYHSKMDTMRDYYQYSAFFAQKSGERKRDRESSNNLLRVYADKNIHFTSAFPTLKVPTTGATQAEREAASLREKILVGTWSSNGGRALQRKWAFDGTIFSAAVALTRFDLRARRVVIERYDPRYCYWQSSNGNDSRITAFWAVYPITKAECMERYGVEPKSQPISTTQLTNRYLKQIDGQDWFLMAIKTTDRYRVAWVGDVIVEEPHDHQMSELNVDVCFPFEDAAENNRGAFYLEPMVPTMARLNLTIERRDSIVSRMANPLVWGRGVINRQLDDTKQAIKNGGFIGLKQGGELGILQLNDVKLLNDHEEALRSDMLRLSGFSQAAMGELAGANTSGDALGMYFTPTQRHIENQNVAWVSFYESINAKILRLYERFATADEKFSLSGFSPRSTVMPASDNPSTLGVDRGAFSIVFDRYVIAGQYGSTVMMNSITPKNELEEKRLVMEAVNAGFISRTTAYEMWGIESPEDEFKLYEQEQSNPVINPQGMQQLVGAANSIDPTGAGGMPGLPSPVAQEISPDVRQSV